VFPRTLRSGQEMVVPQGNWTGTLVLLAPEERP